MAKKKECWTARKLRYAKGVAAGMSKYDAAMDAGYSKNTALSAKSKIETGDFAQMFQNLLRRRISPNKVALRIDQGLDAVEQRHFLNSKTGDIVSSKPSPNFSERRHYAGMAAEMAGYYKPKQQVGHILDDQALERLCLLAERLAALTAPVPTPIVVAPMQSLVMQTAAMPALVPTPEREITLAEIEEARERDSKLDIRTVIVNA